MQALRHLIGKETRLLLRDWHALLLLFAMPAAFILIMSLALQSQFSQDSGSHIGYHVLNLDHEAPDDSASRGLLSLDGFDALPASGTVAELKAGLGAGKAQFLVVVPPGFDARLDSTQPVPLELFAAPDVSAPVYRLFQASVRGAVLQVYLDRLLPGWDEETDEAGISGEADGRALVDRLVQTRALHAGGKASELPSSVQQNVPAWLLFAMFFIAIPLSTTWVHERQQGTYVRLRSMGVSSATLLAGKITPYVAINLLQVVVMLLVGVYLVPRLGGEALDLGQSWAALAQMSLAASFAAVAYALLVANIVTSNEQATIFTGVANLLMAALGGIMVPRFIMPPTMQHISEWSPMAWGLDGFLDIFLRDGGLAMSAMSALKLVGFGAACLLATALLMSWQRRR